MIIKQKGKAWLGLLLGISFFVVLAIFCAPLFGGRNGLEQSDRLFNRLAKGSSYFIPSLTSGIGSVDQQEVAVRIQLANATEARQAMTVLSSAAPETTLQGSAVIVNGNLGQILRAALRDCDAMYWNRGSDLKARYGMDGKQTLLTWFTSLNAISRKLQQGSVADIAHSRTIQTVVTKGVEPAYNFYGIEPETVNHRAGITAFLLAFYLIYTVWWGFAIFFLCEGFGLAMTRARVKQEV